jgi:hypothetical protein
MYCGSYHNDRNIPGRDQRAFDVQALWETLWGPLGRLHPAFVETGGLQESVHHEAMAGLTQT